eukprot:UN19438
MKESLRHRPAPSPRFHATSTKYPNATSDPDNVLLSVIATNMAGMTHGLKTFVTPCAIELFI